MQGEQDGNSACREAVGRNGATDYDKAIHETYSPLSQTAGVEIILVQRDTEGHRDREGNSGPEQHEEIWTEKIFPVAV